MKKTRKGSGTPTFSIEEISLNTWRAPQKRLKKRRTRRGREEKRKLHAVRSGNRPIQEEGKNRERRS